MLAGFRIKRTRYTICFSSQIGCAQNCQVGTDRNGGWGRQRRPSWGHRKAARQWHARKLTRHGPLQFCATGRLGLLGNLQAAQIVGQVVEAKRFLRSIEDPIQISHAVAMGEGEPLANYDALTAALRVLTWEEGIRFGKRNITASSIGRSPGKDPREPTSRPCPSRVGLPAVRLTWCSPSCSIPGLGLLCGPCPRDRPVRARGEQPAGHISAQPEGGRAELDRTGQPQVPAPRADRGPGEALSKVRQGLPTPSPFTWAD